MLKAQTQTHTRLSLNTYRNSATIAKLKAIGVHRVATKFIPRKNREFEYNRYYGANALRRHNGSVSGKHELFRFFVSNKQLLKVRKIIYKISNWSKDARFSHLTDTELKHLQHLLDTDTLVTHKQQSFKKN
jgi:hypothetical protein